MLRPKKVGALPVDGTDKMKQTNEIKIAAPLLDKIDIEGKMITADALLTQRKFASYLVEQRGAHYHFTVKENQPSLLEDLVFYFKDRQKPDEVTINSGHGRVETRSIWVTSELNDYLNFPHVGQAFVIERETRKKSTGKLSKELAYGITSKTRQQADAKNVLATNRGHWCIENSCHYILDWNWDEDRGRIRTGYGPENMTRLRRLAISIFKARGVTNVAQKTRELSMNVRVVFDYLKMTKNSLCRQPLAN